MGVAFENWQWSSVKWEINQLTNSGMLCCTLKLLEGRKSVTNSTVSDPDTDVELTITKGSLRGWSDALASKLGHLFCSSTHSV